MSEECRTDEYISSLGELAESDVVSGDEEEALEAAQDALAFAQSLWDLFADQALHNDGDNPDFVKMEAIIDAINGELAAAVLFINSLNIDAEKVLRKNADLLEEYKDAAIEGEGAANVPDVVIEGNRRLATRIKNTKVILAAKNSTRMMVKPQQKA